MLKGPPKGGPFLFVWENYMEAVSNARFQMWCRLIPHYAGLCRPDKKRAQQEFLTRYGYIEASQLEPLEEDYKMIPKDCILAGCNCEACLEAREYYGSATKTNVPSMREFVSKEKKEPTMNTLNIVASAAQSGAQTLEQDTREYLRARLSKSFWSKTEGLRPAFGLEDDKPPATPKEVIERITSGMYMLPKDDEEGEDENDLNWYRPWDAIRWRDPAKKKDRDGYKLALKTLEKDRDASLDIIMTSDSKVGLEALQKFESTTIH